MSELKQQKTRMLTYGSIEHGKQTVKYEGADWFIQEKIDGSQFTTVAIPDKEYPLQFYCKSKKIGMGANMFCKSMEMMLEVAGSLKEGWSYHSECIQKLRHSTVTYQRIPRMYNIVYDIQNQDGRWLLPNECWLECNRVGLEYVLPCGASWDIFGHGYAASDGNPISDIKDLLDDDTLPSILGLGVTPEGFVLKLRYPDGKYSKFKFVAPEFKEMHSKKKPKPTTLSPSEYCKWIGSMFSTKARYDKAIQHLLNMDDDSKDEHKIKQYMDSDLMKEHSRLIYKYLALEFVPIVKILIKAKQGCVRSSKIVADMDVKWKDDKIYQDIQSMVYSMDETKHSIGDRIFAICLLDVMANSHPVRI